MEFINQTFQVPNMAPVRRLGHFVPYFLRCSFGGFPNPLTSTSRRDLWIGDDSFQLFGGIQRAPPKWRWKKRSHVFPKWRNLFFQGSFSGFIAFGVQTLGFQCLEIPLHGFRHLCFSQWKKETKETVVGNGVFYRIFTKNLLEMSQELSKRLGSVGYKL